jgi:hypothetical protein
VVSNGKIGFFPIRTCTKFLCLLLLKTRCYSPQAAITLVYFNQQINHKIAAIHFVEETLASLHGNATAG